LKEFEFTKHAEDMLQEREIPERWIFDCINNPDRTEWENNETIHYIKAINEFGNRFLRVVVNPLVMPKRIITFFFDKRLKAK
jgi:hypothetical protein